ncbi:Uncharacterized protein Adt_14084 [Abeliophyllum distichum]|uniref:Uncharacterized protein n=1 Tax=Abeliophyllum distichum TaxID=126358 RepID=A0ABD1TYN5_9LAMI
MSNEISISQKSTDTINHSTLKRIKIIKEQRQWMVKTRGFNMESGPSMQPFKGDEFMGDNKQDEEDIPHLSPTHDISRSSFPSSSSRFSFTKDHYNLLNGRIDDLQHSVDGLTSSLHQVLASQQDLQPSFNMIFPPLPPLEY